MPDDIVGARIIGFGTVAWDAIYGVANPIEAAGLVIDYLPTDGGSARRISFGVSDLGVWVAYHGDRAVAPAQIRPARIAINDNLSGCYFDCAAK